MIAEAEVPHVEQPSLAEQSPRTPRRGRAAADFLGGVLAMLLLPLSIVPVLLLGPSVLRAPVALSREGWGDIQRLERRLQPAHADSPHAPAPTPGPSVWRPLVSFGPVYGRWGAFPQAGGMGITWTGTR